VNWLLDHVSEDADYYLNLESDVFVNPKVLDVMVSRIRDTPDICMVFPKQVTVDRQYADFHFCQRGYIPVNEMPDDLTKDRYFNWTHFGCIMIRGEDARNPQIRVDERFKLFCSDQDFSLRIRQITGKHILYTPEGHVMHVGHASSMEGQRPNPDPECFKRIDGKWGNFMVQAGL
jgi:GT2 family glycosyltransferase